jgi:hypothetical protein
MIPPGVEKSRIHGLPSPEVEGNRSAAKEFREAAGEVGLGFLNDIRGIEPTADGKAEVQVGERDQRRTVASQQLASSSSIPSRGPVEQLAGFLGVRARLGHAVPLIPHEWQADVTGRTEESDRTAPTLTQQ